MPSHRQTRTSVHSAINAAGSPAAPTAPSVTSSTPSITPFDSSLPSTLTLSSTRSIRSIEDLAAERLAQPFPPFTATTLQDFMSWTYLVFHQLHLVPGFTPEIFEKPRSELSFDSVPVERVNLLYEMLWDKLYPIVSPRKGVQTMISTIPSPEVHSLWKVLKRGFCPQSNFEVSERGRIFFEMEQREASVTEFTTSVLEERDILKFLGETKSESDVKAVIMSGLASDDAQAFAFRYVTLPLPDFIAHVNSYDMLRSYQRRSMGSLANRGRSSQQLSSSTDSALLTQSTPYSSQEYQCWHCDGWGHVREECPDILIPKEELYKRKHPRSQESSTMNNSDRGRGRGGYSRGGRSTNSRGRNRHRARSRGKYRGTNHYKPSSNATPIRMGMLP